ncbi:MAG: FAD-dependent oxidoreductase [Actinomycetota bacterium]|nr:FAD-dependent oxidoreductase [Actinomycetota bacterium]
MQDVARRVVIVGAGHGGGSTAALLRQGGFDGHIDLVGAEPVGPYHRPPLSKSLLKGELLQPLHATDFYSRQAIALRTGTRVVEIDRAACEVLLDDGSSLNYDDLVIATGSTPRRLEVPGADLEGVVELRTVVDAEVLSELVAKYQDVVVIGGGWIGLEVAAAARDAGVQVTVLEREARILGRVASSRLASVIHECHVRSGTRILTSAAVEAMEAAEDGRVGSVRLADGDQIGCSVVLLAVGGAPDVALAAAAGLLCDNGVLVDEWARTSDPRIYAVGDVSSRPVPLVGDGRYRLESIPSAIEQARQAVAAILGSAAPAPEVPWFWSDQFDQKIQIAGLMGDADTSVVRATGSSYSIVHLRGERLVAIEATNAPRDFIAARNAIRDGRFADARLLADTSVALADALHREAFTPAQAIDVANGNSLDPAPMTEMAGSAGVDGTPRVVFVQEDGSFDAVAIEAGMSLMEAGVRNNVHGIIAECGGTMSCGTCHVILDEQWRSRLVDVSADETDVLEFLDNSQVGSRLGCQIEMTDSLDGIVARIPPSNH